MLCRKGQSKAACFCLSYPSTTTEYQQVFNPDAEWNNYLNPLFLSRGTGSKTSKPEKETIVLFQELVFYFLVMNIFVYLQI